MLAPHERGAPVRRAADPMLELLRARLRRRPNSSPLWQRLGLRLCRHGRFQEALAALESASALAVLSPAAQVAWAECYLATDQPQLARPVVDHLWSGRRDLPEECLPSLARLCMRLGKAHWALQVCREAVYRDPEDDAAVYGLACYMLRLSYPRQRVVALLRRAVHLAPDSRLYRLTLVLCLLHGREREAAYEALRGLPLAALGFISCDKCAARLAALCTEQGDPIRSNLLRRLVGPVRAAADVPRKELP